MTTYTLNPDIAKFPGGEVFPRPLSTDSHTRGDTIEVRARLTNSDQVMSLLMLCDALRREGEFNGCKSILKIPYFPYARQDRVANSGESLSVAVMAGLINGLGFDEVHILDPHSDVTPALVNNVRVAHAHEPVMRHTLHKGSIYENGIYVIPDAGAEKKTRAFAREFGNTRTPMQASKNRCTKTGQITETVLYDNGETYDGPQDFVIVDDICDGGRTFIELAKVIRAKHEVKSLHLHVSHGIFSKGLDVLLEHFDTISTTDSFPKTDHTQLEVLPALWT